MNTDRSAQHERVYRALLEHPGKNATVLSIYARCSIAEAGRSLNRLFNRGLVCSDGGWRDRCTYTPAPGIDPALVTFGRGRSPGSAAGRKLGAGSPRRHHLPRENLADAPQIRRKRGTLADVARVLGSLSSWNL